MESKEESMQVYEKFLDDCEHRVGSRELAADEREKALDVREHGLDVREQNMDAEVRKQAEDMSLSARLGAKVAYEKKEKEHEEECDAWIEKYRMIFLTIFIYSVAVTILWAVHSPYFRNDVIGFFRSIGGFTTDLFRTTWAWAAGLAGPSWICIAIGIILRFVVPTVVLSAISTGAYFAGREYYRHCVDDTSLAFTAAAIAGICFGADVLHWIFPWINVIWFFWSMEGIYLMLRRFIQHHRERYDF